MKTRLRNYLFCFVFTLAVFLMPTVVLGNGIGDSQSFFVDSNYSLDNNTQLNGKLLLSTSRLHFYIESNYWELKEEEEKKEMREYFRIK